MSFLMWPNRLIISKEKKIKRQKKWQKRLYVWVQKQPRWPVKYGLTLKKTLKLTYFFKIETMTYLIDFGQPGLTCQIYVPSNGCKNIFLF